MDELDTYTSTEIGQTTAPIDALQAYTQETSGANVQADAAVYELEANGIAVDLHLSGAMSNRLVAATATPADPVTLTVRARLSSDSCETLIHVVDTVLLPKS